MSCCPNPAGVHLPPCPRALPSPRLRIPPPPWVHSSPLSIKNVNSIYVSHVIAKAKSEALRREIAEGQLYAIHATKPSTPAAIQVGQRRPCSEASFLPVIIPALGREPTSQLSPLHGGGGSRAREPKHKETLGFPVRIVLVAFSRCNITA